MFHFTPRRIEAHVCICFVALKVYKELERLLKLSGCPYSVDEVLRIAETIVTIEIARPENNDMGTKTLCLTKEERIVMLYLSVGLHNFITINCNFSARYVPGNARHFLYISGTRPLPTASGSSEDDHL